MTEWIKKLLSNEIIRYIISGGIVTFVDASVYFLLLQLGVVYAAATVVSIVTAKVVAYVLNKFWVYRTKNKSIMQTVKELIRYIIARGFTGIVDFFGLIILVEIFNCNERVSKIIVIAVVIVLNYILGKKAVFIKNDN